jgi:hypothetical protein
VKILFDNNLSPALAHALQELFKGQHEIVALRDKFRGAPTDVEWIAELSREDRWIIISGDRRITRNRAEYHAFRNSRLVGFFLSKGLYKAKVLKQMERILALWDAMEAIALTVQGGAMFELQMKSSRVQQLAER